jgi:hypothetical protein
MSHERPTPPSQPRPYEVFGFTKEECLDGRVSQDRFKEILEDQQTTVHSVEESQNNYGEFLFVTASRLTAQRRICMAFYGLGYHEYRERWFTHEWFWHQTPSTRAAIKNIIPKDEANEIIHQRLGCIGAHVNPDTQTARGRLFEMLAELTDEDGAYAELQDLDDLGDWLDDESLRAS